jgi:hypothetical protein
MCNLQVIAAEGEQKASRALKEASDIISESPAALQLRYGTECLVMQEAVSLCSPYAETVQTFTVHPQGAAPHHSSYRRKGR